MARATAFFLILLACGATLLAAAVAPAEAAKPCWKQVIDDWSKDGLIDGAYSAACIEEALEKVPEDIRAYSDFEEQAKAARQASFRKLQGPNAGGGGDGGSNSETQPPREQEPDVNAKDETPIDQVLGTTGNNADSVPLPLLILLGLSGALILAGGIGFGARKLQARRARR